MRHSWHCRRNPGGISRSFLIKFWLAKKMWRSNKMMPICRGGIALSEDSCVLSFALNGNWPSIRQHSTLSWLSCFWKGLATYMLWSCQFLVLWCTKTPRKTDNQDQYQIWDDQNAVSHIWDVMRLKRDKFVSWHYFWQNRKQCNVTLWMICKGL